MSLTLSGSKCQKQISAQMCLWSYDRMALYKFDYHHRKVITQSQQYEKLVTWCHKKCINTVTHWNTLKHTERRKKNNLKQLRRHRIVKTGRPLYWHRTQQYRPVSDSIPIQRWSTASPASKNKTHSSTTGQKSLRQEHEKSTRICQSTARCSLTEPPGYRWPLVLFLSTSYLNLTILQNNIVILLKLKKDLHRIV